MAHDVSRYGMVEQYAHAMQLDTLEIEEQCVHGVAWKTTWTHMLASLPLASSSPYFSSWINLPISGSCSLSLLDFPSFHSCPCSSVVVMGVGMSLILLLMGPKLTSSLLSFLVSWSLGLSLALFCLPWQCSQSWTLPG